MSAAEQAAGRDLETFAAPPSRWLGYLGAVATLWFGGWGALSDPSDNLWMGYAGVAAAALCWIALVRPVVTAGSHGLLLKNMLRDTCVPWSSIERARVGQTLQVVTNDHDVFHGLGVTRSARSMVRESRRSVTAQSGRLRVPGAISMFGSSMASGGHDETARGYANQEQIGGSYQGYVESRIHKLASDAQPSTARPVVSWAAAPVAALVVAVVMVGLLVALG